MPNRFMDAVERGVILARDLILLNLILCVAWFLLVPIAPTTAAVYRALMLRAWRKDDTESPLRDFGSAFIPFLRGSFCVSAVPFVLFFLMAAETEVPNMNLLCVFLLFATILAHTVLYPVLVWYAEKPTDTLKRSLKIVLRYWYFCLPASLLPVLPLFVLFRRPEEQWVFPILFFLFIGFTLCIYLKCKLFCVIFAREERRLKPKTEEKKVEIDEEAP